MTRDQVSEMVGSALERVVVSRVFFAHHSVGDNIIDGLREILREAEMEYSVVEVQRGGAPDGAMLLHARPGQNGNPAAKVEDYVHILRSLDTSEPDVAFMKFCYADFDPRTRVGEIFETYRSAMEALQGEYPDVIFAHLTVPLTTRERGLKAFINRLFGRLVWGDAANLKRAEFNKLISSYFEDDPVFDLARIESTWPDGSRELHQYEGKPFFSLVPEYTDDGGHLNSHGQRVVAEEFVQFLSKTLGASERRE